MKIIRLRLDVRFVSCSVFQFWVAGWFDGPAPKRLFLFSCSISHIFNKAASFNLLNSPLSAVYEGTGCCTVVRRSHKRNSHFNITDAHWHWLFRISNQNHLWHTWFFGIKYCWHTLHRCGSRKRTLVVPNRVQHLSHAYVALTRSLGSMMIIRATQVWTPKSKSNRQIQLECDDGQRIYLTIKPTKRILDKE